MTVNIISLIVVLGILIFFHEFGHFIVARYFDIGVEKFSLGFGPRIFGKKLGRTDYIISAVPLGGYVKMVGESPDAEISAEDLPYSFTHKPVGQRALTVAAGPVFNFVLAAFIFFIIFQIHGIINPTVGNVLPNTPASDHGLRTGDEIIAIDGDTMESWNQMSKRIVASGGDSLTMTIKRDKEEISFSITPEKTKGYNEFGEEIDIYDIGILPLLKPVVGSVTEDSPAMRAGLLEGDLILSIDGRKVAMWDDIIALIKESQGRSLPITVQRHNASLSFEITPELKKLPLPDGGEEKRYMIGVKVANQYVMNKLSPVRAFFKSIDKTFDFSRLIVMSVVKMIQGKISSKEIGGPIIIAKMAGDRAREGLIDLMYFTAFISINLGILNLFPIPVLDGGHLLFFSIEAIRKRPVSMKIREVAQQVGLFILLTLMVFVFYNDITKVFFS